MNESIRLNKFLAEQLGLSRRQADDAIAAGRVKVSGKVAILGTRVNPDDIILFDNRPVAKDVKYVYLGLNKPVGHICSRKRQGEVPTIYELLPPEYQNLKTVGRLDKDSSGLILLTNDGDFAFQMTHPKFHKTKLYEVSLDQPLAPLHQQMIADYGVEISDGVSKMGLAKLDDDRKNWLVTLHEGRNRQIRRTFAALGYTVVKLHRIQFGPYQLSGLETGNFTEVPKL